MNRSSSSWRTAWPVGRPKKPPSICKAWRSSGWERYGRYAARRGGQGSTPGAGGSQRDATCGADAAAALRPEQASPHRPTHLAKAAGGRQHKGVCGVGAAGGQAHQVALLRAHAHNAAHLQQGCGLPCPLEERRQRHAGHRAGRLQLAQQAGAARRLAAAVPDGVQRAVGAHHGHQRAAVLRRLGAADRGQQRRGKAEPRAALSPLLAHADLLESQLAGRAALQLPHQAPRGAAVLVHLAFPRSGRPLCQGLELEAGWGLAINPHFEYGR